jgi:hypothetical protein
MMCRHFWKKGEDSGACERRGRTGFAGIVASICHQQFGFNLSRRRFAMHN